jgi:hypothetical protein
MKMMNFDVAVELRFYDKPIYNIIVLVVENLLLLYTSLLSFDVES